MASNSRPLPSQKTHRAEPPREMRRKQPPKTRPDDFAELRHDDRRSRTGSTLPTLLVFGIAGIAGLAMLLVLACVIVLRRGSTNEMAGRSAPIKGTAEPGAGAKDEKGGIAPLATTDSERVLGTWKAVQHTTNGSPLQVQPEMIAIQFTKQTALFTTAGCVVGKYTVKFDPAKEPKQIDLIETNGKVTKAIYEFSADGHRLKLCTPPDSGERPTALAAPLGSNRTLIELQRSLVTGVSNPMAADWKEFNTEDFAAKFPGSPSEWKQSAPYENPLTKTFEKLPMSVYSLDVEGGGYAIAVTRLPSGFSRITSDSVKASVLASSPPRTEVVSDKFTSAIGSFGREWRLRIPGIGDSRMRVFQPGDRLITVRAGPVAAVSDADIDTFFNSLQVKRGHVATKPPEVKQPPAIVPEAKKVSTVGTLAAYAGTWRASFKYDNGKKETHAFRFDTDGRPMWGNKRILDVEQVLSNDSVSKVTVVGFSIRADQISYTLKEHFKFTDSWDVHRYVFTPVQGNSESLNFVKYEQLRDGPAKRLWGKLDRIGD